MDTMESIKKRVSARDYDAKPVEKEKLEKIVDAGRLAPTARGEEPWEFIVITDKEKIKEIAGLTDHGKFLTGATAAIAVFCKDTKYYLEDGCAATENILIAATSLGVASCWIAGDKKAYCLYVTEALGVPASLKLISLIALGYPKTAPVPRKKRSLDEVIHWEKF
ncbi:MAG: nitroreductase family protein [Candidatus Omnitrophota bacterium]